MKYTRIDIKSADDLPKKGKYYCHIEDSGDILFMGDMKLINPENKKVIDWYLIEDTEPSYPEEFVRWCIVNIAMKLPTKNYVYIEDGDIEGDLEYIFKYWRDNLIKPE